MILSFETFLAYGADVLSFVTMCCFVLCQCARAAEFLQTLRTLYVAIGLRAYTTLAFDVLVVVQLFRICSFTLFALVDNLTFE